MKANQLHLFEEALEKMQAATGFAPSDIPLVLEVLTGVIITEEEAGEIRDYIRP